MKKALVNAIIKMVMNIFAHKLFLQIVFLANCSSDLQMFAEDRS